MSKNNNNDNFIEEEKLKSEQDKLAVLRNALKDGEDSGFVENYSLDQVVKMLNRK